MKNQELEYIPLGKSDEYFITHDLGVAAALIVQDCQLVSLDKSERSRVKFIFKGSEDVNQGIQDYWDNKLQGSLQEYFNAIKRLKNQIYSE